MADMMVKLARSDKNHRHLHNLPAAATTGLDGNRKLARFNIWNTIVGAVQVAITGDPIVLWRGRDGVAVPSQPFLCIPPNPSRSEGHHCRILHGGTRTTMVPVDTPDEANYTVGGVHSPAGTPVWSVDFHQPSSPIVQAEATIHLGAIPK